MPGKDLNDELMNLLSQKLKAIQDLNSIYSESIEHHHRSIEGLLSLKERNAAEMMNVSNQMAEVVRAQKLNNN